MAPFASLLSAPAVSLTVSTASSSTVTVSSAGGSAACAIFVKLTLQFKNGTDVPYAIFGRNYFWLTVRTHCSSSGRLPTSPSCYHTLTWLHIAASGGGKRGD